MTDKAVYLSVKKSVNILHPNYVPEINPNNTSESSISNSSEYSPDKTGNISSENTLKFSVDITDNNIFSEEIVSGEKRNRIVLKSGWTNKLVDIIWSNAKLGCVWSFKHGEVKFGEIYCNAFCGECSAELTARTITTKTNKYLQIQIYKIDDKFIHNENKKRRITGDRKIRIVNELKEKKGYCSSNTYGQ